MLKENFQVLRRLAIFFDLCLISAAFFLSYLAEYYLPGFEPQAAIPLAFLPVLLVVWGYLLYRFGMYESFRTREISELLHIIFKSAFFGLLLFSGAMFFLKTTQLDRDFIALVSVIITILLCLEKASLFFVFRSIRVKGFNFRNILIVGLNKRVEHFIGIVQAHPGWGLRLVGIIDQEESCLGDTVNGVKVIGSFKDMADIIHNNVIDEVVFIVPRSLLGTIEEMILLCETEGIKMDIAADFFNLKIAKAKQSEFGGFPLLTFETTTDKLWHLMVRRIADLAISFIGLLLFLPVFILIAILIKLISPGPVFFKQKRVGLKGREFTLYKFRSMVAGAEDQLKELIANNEMQGPVFKMKNDPRIIPIIGKFLRGFSIDELPQLWNVFKGEMSMVGPRPPLPQEVNQYDNWHRRRLSMRPGITCLWQASGRNRIADFDNWTQLDLKYIDNWSLWLDTKIFLKTIPAVLLGIGAK